MTLMVFLNFLADHLETTSTYGIFFSLTVPFVEVKSACTVEIWAKIIAPLDSSRFWALTATFYGNFYRETSVSPIGKQKVVQNDIGLYAI